MSEHQYGEIREGKVFRKAIDGFPEKEIGEVKDTEEAAIAYYEHRYQHLEEKVSQLEQDVHDSANKGSFLMKLLHMKSTLPEYDALGDFKGLEKRLEVLEEHIQEVINQNRKRNLEIKTALLAEGEQLQQVSNWKEAGDFAKDLKMRWIKTGSLDPEHQEAFEEKFNNIINDFFARRNAFFEDRNQLINERTEQYKALIEKARMLVQEKDQREAAQGVKALQLEWKNVGQVPATTRTELWNQLQQIVKPVFAKRTPVQRQGLVKKFNRTPAAPAAGALEAKKELLSKLREITGYDKAAMAKAQQLQEEFKNLGFAPGPEGESVNHAFFQEFSLLKEKNFLHNLAHAKSRDFSALEEPEKNKIKLRLLRDLLGRDERELQNFKDNLSNLNTGKNKINKMMDTKLRLQQRKVEVKRLLMRELQAQL